MATCSLPTKLKILTAKLGLIFLVLWILLIKMVIGDDYNFDINYI